jgi:hypothetical protein
MDETPKELVREAQRGASDRTPVLALTGVTLVVGVFAGALIVLALVLYLSFE